jgi:predicted NAD/FAD-binding protein
MTETRQRVAVVGSGAAGLTAAYLLQRQFKVVLYERQDRPGGHTCTIDADVDGQRLPVDMGFIVMNHRNYPLLTRLLERLNVPLEDSEMSFSYWDRTTGLQYSGSGLGGMFAQRRNLLRPWYVLMIRDILRFFRTARDDLASGACSERTLEAYLHEQGYGDAFIKHHIIPMGAAIWSTPGQAMLQFPAENFVRFFSNHGLLDIKGRPQWRTVSGGSRSYVRKILDDFRGDVRLACPVVEARQQDDQVIITPQDGEPEPYDYAVLACHADQARALYANPSQAEATALAPWRYQPNDTTLHTDTHQMPPLQKVWTSWNYIRSTDRDEDPMMLTYYMNRLQNLPTPKPVLVSLNADAVDEACILHRRIFDHPVYSAEAINRREALQDIHEGQRLFFAGSYLGNGFHEDAVRSATLIAQQWGIEL